MRVTNLLLGNNTRLAWRVALLALLMAVNISVASSSSVFAAETACQKVFAMQVNKDRCARIDAIAHRGGVQENNAVSIENTLTNFKNAYKAGMDGSETDMWPLMRNGVHATGRLAYNHDSDADRTVPSSLLLQWGIQPNTRIDYIDEDAWDHLVTNGGAPVSTYEPVATWACGRADRYVMIDELKYGVPDEDAYVAFTQAMTCGARHWAFQKPFPDSNCQLAALDRIKTAAAAVNSSMRLGVKYNPDCPMTGAQIGAKYKFVATTRETATEAFITDMHNNGVSLMVSGAGTVSTWKDLIQRGLGENTNDAIWSNLYDVSAWLGNPTHPNGV